MTEGQATNQALRDASRRLRLRFVGDGLSGRIRGLEVRARRRSVSLVRDAYDLHLELEAPARLAPGLRVWKRARAVQLDAAHSGFDEHFGVEVRGATSRWVLTVQARRLLLESLRLGEGVLEERRARDRIGALQRLCAEYPDREETELAIEAACVDRDAGARFEAARAVGRLSVFRSVFEDELALEDLRVRALASIRALPTDERFHRAMEVGVLSRRQRLAAGILERCLVDRDPRSEHLHAVALGSPVEAIRAGAIEHLAHAGTVASLAPLSRHVERSGGSERAATLSARAEIIARHPEPPSGRLSLAPSSTDGALSNASDEHGAMSISEEGRLELLDE